MAKERPSSKSSPAFDIVCLRNPIMQIFALKLAYLLNNRCLIGQNMLSLSMK